MIPASRDIGIGITTKNRWDDLDRTLTHLREEGLDQLETIVIDDGSDQPMPADFATRFAWVKFERFEKSEGLIVRRNDLGRLLTAPFYLSLDDDSFPVAGSLAAAAQYLHENPKASALSLCIITGNDPVPTEAAGMKPRTVKAFVGCGFIVRRELFLSLDGFEKRLYIYHEEPEYCVRTFLRGYDTVFFPGVVVRHMVAPGARQSATRTRYFIRNIILLDLWYYPTPMCYVRALGHALLLYIRMPMLRPNAVSVVQGWVEGFICYARWAGLKTRLTAGQNVEWERRSSAHDAMQARSQL